MSGQKGNLISRFSALLFMALAFATCAAMLTQGERSLFSDGAYAETADAR